MGRVERALHLGEVPPPRGRMSAWRAMEAHVPQVCLQVVAEAWSAQAHNQPVSRASGTQLREQKAWIGTLLGSLLAV